MIDRRQFLLLRPRAGAASLELSCEALYMRFVDPRLSGTTEDLLARLEQELRGARSLRLTDSAWLARDELRSRIEPLLEAFRARHGHVELA